MLKVYGINILPIDLLKSMFCTLNKMLAIMDRPQNNTKSCNNCCI